MPNNRALTPTAGERKNRVVCHILAPEYPPAIGGVGDYTRLIARELAELGSEVHVWVARASVDRTERSGISVHAVGPLTSLGKLRDWGARLDEFPGTRWLLVQWVPHGYGLRSMNLLLCVWLWLRAVLKGDRLELMVHEPSLGFRPGKLLHNSVGVVHRMMLMVLLRAARRVYTAIPAWEPRLRPFALGRNVEMEWLPIPSSVPVLDQPNRSFALRKRYGRPGGKLVGHFGTHAPAIADLLCRLVPELLRSDPAITFLLIGQNGEAVQARLKGLEDRVCATGVLPLEEVSLHLQACDLMLQPYPDGVSTRRSSAMAALAHGVALATTCGALSEDFWSGGAFAATVPVTDLEALIPAVLGLLYDSARRQQIARTGQQLYRERLEARRTAERLLQDRTSDERALQTLPAV